GNDLLAHSGEEPLEGFDGAFLTNPEQAGDTQVDLIDQSQVFVALGILDFIKADGVDLAERAMREAPGDDMLNGIKNLFPGGAKRLSRFFPREAARPTG